MPLGIFNVEWLNQNATRSYPLTDWATKKDKTGTIKLPDSFILALYLPVHAGMDVEPDKFFLHTLAVFPTGYNVAIGYDDDTDNPPVIASVNIAKSTHTEDTSYALSGSGDFDDSVGKIVIGKLAEIDSIPPGMWYFDPAGGAIDADAIRPMIRGVVSITCVNGNDRSEPLYGDIELIAGDNMRIVANTFGDDANPEVVFSAIDGEGLNEQCICDEVDDGVPIRTINGIQPLPNGDFRLTSNECITLNPITNGLQIVDTCSAPCCGCQELTAVLQQLDRLNDGVVTYKNFTNRVATEVSQMSLVVLGSRLGDNGCVEC